MFHATFKGGPLLAALLISTAAHAELTADQVWTNWKAVSAASGQIVTAASEAREGDTLAIKGLTIVSTFDGGSINGTIEAVNFRELGDGTVEVTMSPEYPVVVNSIESDGRKIVINVAVRQPDLKIIASGSEAETRYDFTAPFVKAVVSEVTVEEKPIEMTLEVDVTALGGSYLVTAGTPKQLASSITADSAAVTLAMTDPETGGKINMKGNVSDLVGNSTGNLLDTAMMADMSQALKAGFATDGSLAYGAGTFEFDMAEAADTTKGSATIGSGNIVFALDADRLNYGGGSKDVEVTLSGAWSPLPSVAMSYGEAAFNLLMPVSKSDEPGDFAFLMKLVDFTLSDDVWSLLDPEKVLPRDPATIVIDTGGKANWGVDIMDPDGAEELAGDTMPVQLHALDVTNLTLKAAGAEVTGDGAFTFDNADTTTFPGIPLPTGQLDLKIVGANGLVDKLVQMGLLPEDQAMSARMMMGLFANAVEGSDDTLTSTLEFKEKGLFVNGQRLQ
ncbi:MAG: DUF2125 domain-containing protein [Rhodobacter sp.]|nr:DUF2125 domain-containing protein [Rhodobacter sp.]MCA3494174.1 DUF2125 domain-containing protein [Rhodobacter sp.]MCA3499585.1 DUF2125 domain-containing protein [Rhodobacter sp.]MCA3505194.1 DUF2125 domain-containing protein [Rhodobacter sp.]MCA3515401.1 DUF2125 domain-containing protein [Rhodobacter sp.]